MRVDDVIPRATLDHVVPHVLVGRDDEIGVLTGYTARRLRNSGVPASRVAEIREALRKHGLALKGEST